MHAQKCWGIMRIENGRRRRRMFDHALLAYGELWVSSIIIIYG